MVMVTFFSVLTIMVPLVWFYESYEYLCILLGLLSGCIGVLILNHFDQIYVARFLMTIAVSLAGSAGVLVLGGFFSQGSMVLTILIVGHVAFDNRPALRKVIYAITLVPFVSAVVYVNQYEVVSGVVAVPYDEIIILGITVAWSLGLVLLFEKEKKDYIFNLSRKNQDLENKTEELERFTYIASHDLKSPLVTIGAFLDLIEKDLLSRDSKAAKTKLVFAQKGAKQMNALIEGVLELSKMNNLRDSKRTSVNLNEVISKVEINLLAAFKNKKAVLDTNSLPEIYANELEMVLLFQNFIQNGIKYNESKHPKVTVYGEKKDGYVVLIFEDNGIGIDEKYYGDIFQYFKRLHASNEYNGTGLGLGLCKKIIDAYDGEVKIDSVLGQGTRFEIRLLNREASLVGA